MGGRARFVTGKHASATGRVSDGRSRNKLASQSRSVTFFTHLALHELGQLGERQRRPVDLGHKQTLQHDLVEVAVGTAHQEAVQLRAGK